MSTRISSSMRLMALVVVGLLFIMETCFGFVPQTHVFPSIITRRKNTSSSSLHQAAARDEQTSSSPNNDKRRKDVSLRQVMDQLEQHPAALNQSGDAGQQPKSKSKRTRKRVNAPKQQYLYAAQRKELEQKGKITRRNGNEPQEAPKQQQGMDDTSNNNSPSHQARQLGLVNVASSLHCDPQVDNVEPKILGKIRVDDNANTAGAMAYIINKPAGWSILGSAPKKKKKTRAETTNKKKKKSSTSTITRVKDEEGDVLEFNEADVLALMTPEERAEFLQDETKAAIDHDIVDNDDDKAESSSRERTKTLLASSSNARPSLVGWLKETMLAQGTPVRGGKYWTAVAGATAIDDSGLVVLCPKDSVKSLFVDAATYVAVVGNGKFFTPKSKTKNDDVVVAKELTQMEIISKLRKGRGDDPVVTVGVTFAEQPSTCTSVIQPCQAQLQDGIRGDACAHALDRRAPRRLIHCNALSISSLVHDDDTVTAKTESWPDDISILSNRRNHHEFTDGSFLGRAELRDNSLTNAHREINGQGDGFPGWTVDRYDKWLFVQHDEKYPRGPLPSIHDGNTAGVYYLAANPNRGAMGRNEIRPKLLEGQPASDILPVLENGVTYHVHLDKDLSTGIFLDQRLQRAWLTRNCNQDTRVLNCFAHCGAFSIAAASAGASTVSLDLNKKWLDRIQPQMEANGIDFDDKHDCIYGDCFDWLARLGKRGEQYDIVIIDPPSSSVGKKKKRWSVKKDMDELVALAAPLVKKGGLLWTMTNSASLTPIKFGKLCKKGLDAAGIAGARLERVVSMPHDFPSIGTQPVKNLVWRL